LLDKLKQNLLKGISKMFIPFVLKLK